MIDARQIAKDGQPLSHEAVRKTLHLGLAGRFKNKSVLILIPDHTRSIPLPALFQMLVEVLADSRQIDFMVALGTHPPLDNDQLLRLIGITGAERSGKYKDVGLLNHDWQSDKALVQIGVLTRDYIQETAGSLWHPSLGGDVPVRINRRILDYDHILILGPTFPHEVAGFSGGAKYLFPGSERFRADHSVESAHRIARALSG
jgi:nickel-dependent lactate racemase